MKHLHDLLAQFPWWQLHPDHSRVLDLPKSFVKRPVFARTESFDTALGYLPTQDPIALNLEGFPQKLRARCYNPRTGEYAGHSEERAPSSRVHFTPPGAGDWVLVLESKAKAPERSGLHPNHGAWTNEALELPPGAMTVWSFNGKNECPCQFLRFAGSRRGASQ